MNIALSPRLKNALPPLILFVAILLLWEYGVAFFQIEQFLLPAPTHIAGAFADNLDALWTSAQMALWEAFGGLLLGCALAITSALVAVRWDVAQRALLPFAIGFNAVPVLVFAPIMNNWFGSVNPLSKMMIVVTLVYYPIMINVVRGLTRVDPLSLELLHSYGASSLSIFRKLRIPNALPYFFNAMKLSATLSVIGVVVAGYFGGARAALGVWILNEVVLFRFPNAWAGIVVACAIGIGFYVVVVVLERIFMGWHESIRSAK